MFVQVREEDKAEFESILNECGFSPTEDSGHKRLAVNLARNVWVYQQMRIDEVKGRVGVFTRAFEDIHAL